MKQLTFRNLAATLAICSIGFLSASASASASALAGQDEYQRQMMQRLMHSKQKLQQAEVARGAERQKLMGDHMKMMQETMQKMQEMQPQAGMTMQQHEEWMNEHQKLMGQMMEQMMGEHHMMMGMDCMSTGNSDDTHKH